MTSKLNYQWNAPVKVTETSYNRATISGVLIAEGTSRNGHLYELTELRNIAKQACGVPINFGTVSKLLDTKTGLVIKNAHDESPNAVVGKIIRTTFSPKRKLVTFFGEIWNTKKFPNIVQEVKNGFGISIGGFIQYAQYVIDKAKRHVLQIKDMIVQHVQLVSPKVVRGQDQAKVETVLVHESMSFYANNGRLLSRNMLFALVIALELKGYLS